MKPTSLNYQWQLVLTAVMFYTRLPVPKDLPYSAERLNQSRKYFPLIGILIGSLAAIALVVTAQILPVLLAVVLSTIVSILATGAFHEDGFADSCDGLGGGWSRDEVLKIMKDSRVGTYGALGLTCILSLKVISLFYLASELQAWLAGLMLITGHCWSRQLSSIGVDLYHYAQDPDVSKVKPITEHPLSWSNRALSALIALLPLAILMSQQLGYILAALLSSTVCFLFFQYVNRRLNGVTGDILGAAQQIAEVTFYLVCLVYVL